MKFLLKRYVIFLGYLALTEDRKAKLGVEVCSYHESFF